MKVLITGANGFIGKNLRVHLSERDDIEIVIFSRKNNYFELINQINDVDFIFHLAGVNRPSESQDFYLDNVELTTKICAAVASTKRSIPVIFSSSIQAEFLNSYGDSKRQAEEILFSAQEKYDIPIHIFRLPNVFGKWCKPNYNSVVATFCHNIARDIPSNITNPEKSLSLVYIDDLINRFIDLMDSGVKNIDSSGFEVLNPIYNITVGELFQQISKFNESRQTLITQHVGTGLLRALYSTYMSYLPISSFKYQVPEYCDARGKFVEFLKTSDSGQISFFTSNPGITRGLHYHHTKTEKFMVIQGKAKFTYCNILSGRTFDLIVNEENSTIVESIPGWLHSIENIGDTKMIVMLWANEIFDRSKPDTIFNQYKELGNEES